MNDLSRKQELIEILSDMRSGVNCFGDTAERIIYETLTKAIDLAQGLPSEQPETEKYEYHYDHTDCIWYRPEARNRCPTTCAQYRDGWNDAMNYIFRDGKGYRPYRRDKQYGE